MTRRCCLAVLAIALPSAAHVVSMSTGDAKLNGARLDYELRMPLYEAAHLSDPDRQLFENIRFHGGGSDARLLTHSCVEEAPNLVCRALFLFERDVDRFDVKCTFASITVPNHVHLLRASNGPNSDQAAFDGSFTEASLRFRPPTRSETAVRDASAGFWRAVAGLVQLLFLAALVLAGRSRRELMGLAATFMAGQAVAIALSLSTRVLLSPRFIEAAAALTIAYLAVELLLLPKAGQRWIVAGILGVLHGVYFDMLIQSGDYGRVSFAAGVLAAEVLIAVAFWAALQLAKRLAASRSAMVERGLASLLLITGLSWFVVRLRG